MDLKKMKKPKFSLGKNKKLRKSKNVRMKLKVKGDLLSINLGSKLIKAVVGREEKGVLNIKKMCSIELEENIYREGEIKNDEALKEAIKKLLGGNNIKIKNVIMTIDSDEIIKREIDLPLVPEDTLLGAITFEMGEYLPINKEQYILQFKEILRFKEDDVVKQKFLVYALKDETALRLYNFLQSLNLKPEVLDIESNALMKLVKNNKINNIRVDQGSICYIDVGNESSNVTIMKDSKYEFSRIIKSKASIEDNLVKNNVLTKEEARTYLEKYSKENVFTSELNKKELDIQREIINTADMWIADIIKILQYYITRNKMNHIDFLFLYGGGSKIKNIEYYVGNRLNIPTETINNIEKIKFSGKNLNVDKIYLYVNAIGALVGR